MQKQVNPNRKDGYRQKGADKKRYAKPALTKREKLSRITEGFTPPAS